MPEYNRIITEARAYACLDCGRCTASCPISRFDPDYSPRKLVGSAVTGDKTLTDSGKLWSCLTCGMCEARCQSGVQYSDLIRSLRAEAFTLGKTGQCTHGGALQSLMHIMTADRLNQRRLDWVGKSLKTAVTGDTLYFTGCLPYFDVIFSRLKVNTIATAKGAVKLLNRLDVVPALLPNERCCGHDLLWSGDTEGFIKLAEQNIRQIKDSGAKRVVTTCPECYHTLKVDYTRCLGNLPFEVIHISELLARAIKDGKLSFRRSAKKVTYHDPCRLGRLSGIFNEPRAVIEAVPGLELAEMQHNQANALCCGTQAWMNCGAVNKQIQSERLREAAATGAATLVTACPKCQIHLACALNDGRLDKELGLEIVDLTSLAAKALAT